MKKFLFILLCYVCINANAQDLQEYTIKEKFIFHP